MLVLVDGHNAIHALGLTRGGHEAARSELVLRVAEEGAEAEVFFDARSAPKGLPEAGREHGVVVRFCRRGPADEAILARLRAGGAREFLVVTDDRELAGRARQLGAGTKAVREFFTERAPPPAEEKRPGGRDFAPGDFGLPEQVNLKRPPRDLRSGR